MHNEHFSGFLVGVNVFVVRDGMLLLGKRSTGLGDGHWGLPGGHVEKNELFFNTARRELLEETGLEAGSFSFINVVNHPRPGLDKHYVQIAMQAHGVTGEPKLLEPHACYEWKWFPLANLPEPLFFGHRLQIELFIKKEYFGEEIDAHIV